MVTKLIFIGLFCVEKGVVRNSNSKKTSFANAPFSYGKSKSDSCLYCQLEIYFYLIGEMDMRRGMLVLSACVLTACGGGGSGGGDSTSKLSATQAAFESFYLSPNLAYYASGYLPTTGVPSAGSSYYFYDILESVPNSPSAGTQRVTSPSPVNLTLTLPLPSSETGSWYLADGGFYQRASPVVSEITYLDGEVVETILSQDLKHRLASGALTQVTVTSLTGPIVSDAGEGTGLLPTSIYTNAALTKAGAVWGSGAAYATLTNRYTTDWYRVDSPSSPLESNTTIANLIANNRLRYDSKFYGANDGSVSVVQGVKVYVAKDPLYVAMTRRAASYVVFYELNGNVYTGQQTKAGSVSTRATGYNAQARASIKAALTF